MKEEKVSFHSSDLSLEGLFCNNTGEKSAIIAHPHPQMGGNMYNNVVEAMVQAIFNSGYSTLRFNFRGVGRSQGTYDNGRGEVADALTAKDYLTTKGKNNPIISGYSFGAVVMMEVYSREDSVQDIIMVSPPIDIDNLRLLKNRRRGLIICGNEDQFCKSEDLKNWSEENNFKFKMIEGADHFYMGMEDVIRKHIEDYLSK